MKKILFFLTAHSSLLAAFSQNVGIGTTNPFFKLDVRNGSINTDSVYRIGTNTVLAVPGTGNLFVGKDAGRLNTGVDNTFSGDQAGYSNSAGLDNSFFGKSAGYSNNMGSANAFFSGSAGYSNTSGSYNSFFGGAAGYANTIGFDNSFFGLNAGYTNISGNSNSFFGRSAGYNTTGNLNSFFGISAGTSNTTGSNNTALGSIANVSTGTLNNATAIGYRSYVSQDNSLVLGSINGINGATSSTKVGIGTSAPLTPLDIKSASASILRLDGGSGMYVSFYENGVYRSYIGSYSGNAEDADFGTGSGNTTGKLHLTIQASPKLTLNAAGDVGIGNTSPSYRLDVNGDMNLTGAMRINGSAGTAGQVLVSNGTGSPTWKNAAFNNSVRFAGSFNSAAGTYFSTLYNYSPADVSIGSSNIAINKSGLYHIDGYLTAGFVAGCSPTLGPTLSCILTIGGVDFWIATYSNLIRSNAHADFRYYQTYPFSYDTYISAPATIGIGIAGSFGAPCSWTDSHSGRIAGYLISE